MSRHSSIDTDRLKADTPISDIIGQHVTWDRKKTQASKGDFWACCPFHGEKSPSFHCEDSKGRYFCFGCGAKGDHFTFLQEYVGLSFKEAVQALGGDVSVNPDPERAAERKREREAQIAQAEAEKQLSDDERADIAAQIFAKGVGLADTPAEKYLLDRGIPAQKFPLTKFRFVERLSMSDALVGDYMGLVGAVTDVNGNIRAIWRVFINADGTPRRNSSGQKVKLGLGPAAGCAVRLSSTKSGEIAVCEGMETAFGVKALTNNRIPVWAALSTSGMQNLELPSWVKRVRIYADGDMARFNEGKKVSLMMPPGRMAAVKLAGRCREQGIEPIISEPPQGSDWLDVWNGISQYG